VLEELPEADRDELNYVLTASWYPFDLNQRLDEAIVASVGEGDARIFESIGAWSAKKNLAGAHKAFLTPGDPLRFMDATDRIYRFYYDTGHRPWEADGPTSGVMTTFEAETYSHTDCLTVIGWYKEALTICGARNVVIDEETCRAEGGPHCRYRFRWDA
jgi:hypothetical protein